MIDSLSSTAARSVFRKRFFLAILSIGFIVNAPAADYPTKNVTIIVPYPAGGTSDVQARIIAAGLTQRLGQAVIVDNRPGAGGRIGAAMTARATPDGHTLMVGSCSVLAIEPALRANAGYDPLRDFIPIALISEMPFVLVVSPSVSAKNLDELLAVARKHPGELTYGSWGLGTTNHLVTEQFKHLTKVDLLHVPYKGGAPAMADIVSGHISMLFSLAADSLSQIKAGKVRALATSASKRLSVLPDVPTLAELGIHGIEMQHWYGVVTPAKTPADIVTRLRAEVSTVLKGPEFTRWLESQGSSPVAGTSEVLTNRIRADMAQAEKIAKSISLKLDD